MASPIPDSGGEDDDTDDSSLDDSGDENAEERALRELEAWDVGAAAAAAEADLPEDALADLRAALEPLLWKQRLAWEDVEELAQQRVR